MRSQDFRFLGSYIAFLFLAPSAYALVVVTRDFCFGSCRMKKTAIETEVFAKPRNLQEEDYEIEQVHNSLFDAYNSLSSSAVR